MDRLKCSEDVRDIGDRIHDEHGKNAEAYFYQHYAHTIENEWSIYFDGMNCDEHCGWDGASNRCNCYNRRVSWVWDSRHGCLSAEAYKVLPIPSA